MNIKSKYRKVSGIYKITNLINGKFYIGSSVDVYQRGYTYNCLANQNKIHNKHLQNSINKYGIQNFDFQLIEEILFEKDQKTNDKLPIIQKKEQYYVDLLKPIYNKKLIVDSSIGQTLSQETKDKISKSLKEAFKTGRKKYNRVYRHTIPVTLFTKNGEFYKSFVSCGECSEYLNTHSSLVAMAVKSKRKILYDYLVLKTSEAKDILKYVGVQKIDNTSKKLVVLNVENNEVLNFKSFIEFQRLIKTKHETIVKYIKSGMLLRNKYKIISYD